MFISVFDIFKIGIGPSSSHTVGPMVAAARFLESLAGMGIGCHRVRVSLHGSLAHTGKGHASDRAVLLGLSGLVPDRVDAAAIAAAEKEVAATGRIGLADGTTFCFDPSQDLHFDYGPPLPGHANGLRFTALGKSGETLLQETYYSIGGGFVVREGEAGGELGTEKSLTHPFAFATADAMLALGKKSRLSIAAMKRANECLAMDPAELDRRLDHLWAVMAESIARGLSAEGELPGGLGVKRRAKDLHRQVMAELNERPHRHPLLINEWLSLMAMAINEENASGGRIVTAPTNGAAGVIPAVIHFHQTHYPDASNADIRTFLLVAAAIGGIIKYNGSISGAEVGCQGEVGSASAMAAAGLCAVLGGTNEQIENAAEIALEHHLGMTCDPVRGLVQIPCIERNGFGAVKAVSAAMLALRGDGSHHVSLDRCIRTMYQTGLDMNDKYKETSLGGLAVNTVDC